MKKALLPWQLVNHIVSGMRCKASWVNTHLPPCVTSSAGNGSFVEEHVQNCGTVQISLSLLQKVDRSNPKCYFCMGRSVIRIGRNIGGKKIKYWLFCWDLPQSRPWNLTMTMYLKLMPCPLHQKTIHNSPGKKSLIASTEAARHAAAHRWLWSCYRLQPSAPPFWGMLPPPKHGHLIYPSQAAACFAGLWYYQHIPYQLSAPFSTWQGTTASRTPHPMLL